MMSEHAESQREYQIALIKITPGLTADWLVHILGLYPNARAVLLEGYTTGTTPDRINPIIKQCAEGGIPVFIVSSNFGDKAGIMNKAYDPHKKATEAGAIHIETKNINRIDEIMDAIQDEIDSGKTGQKLAEAVRKKHFFAEKN